jgi:hypothetical protein
MALRIVARPGSQSGMLARNMRILAVCVGHVTASKEAFFGLELK